jgi:hypothetical protein
MGLFNRSPRRSGDADKFGVSTKAVFMEEIKAHWFPLLREAGFKGSGGHFRRIREPWAHCIFVQSKSDGSACCVNLGAEPRLQPIRGFTDVPEFTKIKEVECEVRDRLKPRDDCSDWWWTYGRNSDEANGSAASLRDTWLNRGEEFFAQYSDLPGPAANTTLADFEAGRAPFFHTTKVRAVLLYARIFMEVRDFPRAIEFSKHGISICGGGWLQLTFKDIIDRCQTAGF